MRFEIFSGYTLIDAVGQECCGIRSGNRYQTSADLISRFNFPMWRNIRRNSTLRMFCSAVVTNCLRGRSWNIVAGIVHLRFVTFTQVYRCDSATFPGTHNGGSVIAPELVIRG